jgi:hypothetical protein
MVYRKKRAKHCRGVSQEWRKKKRKEQSEGNEGAEDEKGLEAAGDENQGDGTHSYTCIYVRMCFCISQCAMYEES